MVTKNVFTYDVDLKEQFLLKIKIAFKFNFPTLQSVLWMRKKLHLIKKICRAINDKAAQYLKIK